MKALAIRRTILFLTLAAGIMCQGQEHAATSKKLIKKYEEAEVKMQGRNFSAAIEILHNIVVADSNFTEAWLMLADAYDATGNEKGVAESCKKAITSGGDTYPVAYFFLTQSLSELCEYADALKFAQVFLLKNVATPKQKAKVLKIVANCEFALQAMQHPVTFAPKNMGDNINSKYDEYWPSISADESQLSFTRLVPINAENTAIFHNRQEDIYSSKYTTPEWQKAVSIGEPINSPDNEGAPFLTSDGNTLYFTVCGRYDSKGKCDIYTSEKHGDIWSVPQNLGAPLNSIANEKQPSLSGDGKILYFSSDRAGSKGAFDIWSATRNEEGKWLAPQNAGDSINTAGDEQSPFIHSDNQTLYFSSNGWPGMGKNDLYLSRKKDTSQWTQASNLGYPINTCADETGIIVNAKGNRAFFSSNREEGKGRDIYEFELYKVARPLLVTYLKAKVFDAETKQNLDASIELIDLATNRVFAKAKSGIGNGEFLVCLPNNKNYALNVSKENYLFYSDNFALATPDNETEPFIKDIALFPIKKGNSVVLKNIFFETGSYTLKDESVAELNKLIRLMLINSHLSIEIEGHTDNSGLEATNKILSENRASEVCKYLTQHGIDTKRLSAKGYGSAKPVDENTTEQGRANNRRTEFKVTGN